MQPAQIVVFGVYGFVSSLHKLCLNIAVKIPSHLATVQPNAMSKATKTDSVHQLSVTLQWWIQEANPRVRGENLLFCKIFAENYMRMEEIGTLDPLMH